MRAQSGDRSGGGLVLPAILQRRVEAAARALLEGEDAPRIDFTQPAGEPALVPPDSVSWRVFKNPVALFIGGVTAVILELGEPRVRAGVWEHTSFRSDPVRRLRRTGLAAMVTVYGARSTAERMIASIGRLHERIAGITPCGRPYRANDPELLTWVQATASFGFLQAYHSYAHPLSAPERDRYYAEGQHAGRLYGAEHVPASEAGLNALFRVMAGRLEPSPILFDFLTIMQRAPIFPAAMRPFQRLMVKAAVGLTPGWARERLGLRPEHAAGLGRWEAALLRRAGSLADRLVLEASPAVRSCLRLGLPADYLFRPEPPSSGM